jgi:hypothetical protein
LELSSFQFVISSWKTAYHEYISDH